MSNRSIRMTFPSRLGHELAARLDMPVVGARAYALFAHCFTCTKDIFAARRIAATLASLGVAVLRFDFTGLGSSEGEFQNTNFSSNVDDLVRAADHLGEHYRAQAIVIGHSLGGAAVLAAAHRMPEAKAVVTIGAPFDVAHVLHHFQAQLDDIEDGIANVTLAGRTFPISKGLIEDAKGQALQHHVAHLHKALLVMHAPQDQIVGIENATSIFTAARHPKSFISLDTADHLLSGRQDAAYAAQVIAAWASRYIPQDEANVGEDRHDGVVAAETGAGKFQNAIATGRQRLVADEPASVGGLDSGPSPYDYLAAALAACTAMTLRVYAEHKQFGLGRVTVSVRHGKLPAEHCHDCGEAAEGRAGQIDRFERTISVEGGVDAVTAGKLIEIVERGPVHRTLETRSAVATKVLPS